MAESMSADNSGSRHDISDVAARVIAHAEDISEIKADMKGLRTDVAALTAAELRREGARKVIGVGYGVIVAMAGALGWFAAHYKP